MELKKWIFISHSHKDINKARIVRNYLENISSSYEPLLFYLKCLNDDCEIEDLIKREIDARNVYIYLDSPNSKKSKWVQSERDYIESKHGKLKLLTISINEIGENITEKICNQLKAFDRIMRKTFFILFTLGLGVCQANYKRISTPWNQCFI